MNVPILLAATGGNGFDLGELSYVWQQATFEAKVLIFLLLILSIISWSVMIIKFLQMSKAAELNNQFSLEFKDQKHVLAIFDRRLNVESCPIFMVYQAGSLELDARLKNPADNSRKKNISLKGMEHIKRTVENTVAQESLKLESLLIWLAIAVSGAPFMGLLGTVWGVMSTFGHIARQQSASLTAMAPGVSAALLTTVAGLLVAIPAMFAYNFLVHKLRVQTVGLDNFAQELISKMETEYLEDKD